MSGIVQGVYCRDFVVGEATALAITGWVRNRSDGRVEIMAEGTESALSTFAERLKQGPPLATVTAVDVHTIETPAEVHYDFRQLETLER